MQIYVNGKSVLLWSNRYIKYDIMSAQSPAVMPISRTCRSLSLLYPFSGSLKVVFFGIFDFEPDFFILNGRKYKNQIFINVNFIMKILFKIYFQIKFLKITILGYFDKYIFI